MCKYMKVYKCTYMHQRETLHLAASLQMNW